MFSILASFLEKYIYYNKTASLHINTVFGEEKKNFAK